VTGRRPKPLTIAAPAGRPGAACGFAPLAGAYGSRLGGTR
jgi:hypothetical protein